MALADLGQASIQSKQRLGNVSHHFEGLTKNITWNVAGIEPSSRPCKAIERIRVTYLDDRQWIRTLIRGRSRYKSISLEYMPPTNCEIRRGMPELSTHLPITAFPSPIS